MGHLHIFHVWRVKAVHRDCSHGSVANSTFCAHREPKFGSWHPCWVAHMHLKLQLQGICLRWHQHTYAHTYEYIYNTYIIHTILKLKLINLLFQKYSYLILVLTLRLFPQVWEHSTSAWAVCKSTAYSLAAQLCMLSVSWLYFFPLISETSVNCCFAFLAASLSHTYWPLVSTHLLNVFPCLLSVSLKLLLCTLHIRDTLPCLSNGLLLVFCLSEARSFLSLPCQRDWWLSVLTIIFSNWMGKDVQLGKAGGHLGTGKRLIWQEHWVCAGKADWKLMWVAVSTYDTSSSFQWEHLTQDLLP